MENKTIFQINGSKQEDVVRGLRKAGFRLASMNKPIGAGEMRDILGTLTSRIRQSLSSGESVFIPRERAEFSNGEDSVIVDDFDIMENQIVRSDPVIIILERIPGRTSSLVREILEDTVKVDIIKYALKSIRGGQFITSIIDLAGLTDEDPNVVYERCVKTLISSCVSGIKRIDVRAEDLMQTRTVQKIPMRAV